MRLLVTRPEPDAERTAAALRAKGHAVTIAPLLRVEIFADAELGAGPWAAILVTSANAAHAITAHKRVAELQALPVLAVGERTADAMRAAGFADVSSAEGSASDLTKLAAARLKHGEPLLYLAGADRSSDIAADLAAQNFLVSTVVVYRAVQVDVLPAAAAESLERRRRWRAAFLAPERGGLRECHAEAAGLSEAAIKKPVHFCLSAQVAEPLAKAGAVDIRDRARANRACAACAHPCNFRRLIFLAKLSMSATCCRHLGSVLCRGERRAGGSNRYGFALEKVSLENMTSEPDSTPRRRPPTIDLTAKEVETAPGASAQDSAAAESVKVGASRAAQTRRRHPLRDRRSRRRGLWWRRWLSAFGLAVRSGARGSARGCGYRRARGKRGKQYRRNFLSA